MARPCHLDLKSKPVSIAMANNCPELNTLMGDVSIFDEKKEERALSCQEDEEDSCHQPLHENGCTTTTHENDALLEEEELKELRKRLDHLRKRRRRIQQSTKIDCVNQRELLLRRLNSRRRDRAEIIDEYLSAWKGRDSVALFLDCSKRWNVLNDCFPIWIDGKSAFATINGCRLGAEAPPLPNDLLIAARSETKSNGGGKWVISGTTATNGHQQNQILSPPKRSILGLFGNNNEGPMNDSDNKGYTISEPIRVPVLEINAALGHACLLLKVLQESSSKRGGTGMKFTHELHPMGATSKIGIRFGTSGVLATAAGILSSGSSSETSSTFITAPIVYNLFLEENSGFSFFKKNARNFNWALQAFLQCIAEAAAQQADKTIAIPHVIQHNKDMDNRVNHLGGGEWTIGGLSICYPSQQQPNEQGKTTSQAALEWTRACRFLLTDLKWLVAYAAKHVDR